MSQNPDPFSLQFDPMTPRGPVTSQLEETPPPLPPRPHLRRRPVPPPGAAGSQSAASPPQCPQFGELGGYPSSSLSSSPRYNFRPPDDPSSSLRSPPTYSFSPHDAGYSPVPSAMPAPSSPSIQPSQVIVNGVALGQADLLTLQAVVGLVLPGSYWSVQCHHFSSISSLRLSTKLRKREPGTTASVEHMARSEGLAPVSSRRPRRSAGGHSLQTPRAIPALESSSMAARYTAWMSRAFKGWERL
jgi:hypothetical protein